MTALISSVFLISPGSRPLRVFGVSAVSWPVEVKNTKNTGALDLHDCPTRHLERWWEIITWSNVLCNVLADFWQRLFCSSESSHLDAGIIIGFLKQYKKPQELCVAIVLNPKCYKQPWNISPLKVQPCWLWDGAVWTSAFASCKHNEVKKIDDVRLLLNNLVVGRQKRSKVYSTVKRKWRGFQTSEK